MPQDEQPLSIKQRRRRNRKQIIDDIVQLARDMIRADGAAALSFNAIARQLGIKPPSLYTYFDSKHAIYDELFQRGWRSFTQHMDQIPRTGTLQAQMVAMCEAYMRFAQENPDYYQIMFQRPVPDFMPSDESMALSLASLAQFTEYLHTLLEHENLKPGIPTAEARDIILALNHGLTELHLANNPELPAGEGRYGSLIQQAVTVLLKAWSTQS